MGICGSSPEEPKTDPGSPTEYDKLLKVLIIGDSSVGKSSLLVQYTEGNFTDTFISTIGVDFKIQTLNMNGQRVRLQIWDTAGQEKFRTITSSYYRGTHGVIVVFDLSNQETFDHVQNWMAEIDKSCGTKVKKLLVGNKSDLEKTVSEEQIKELIENENIPYIETSAKNCSNVKEAFKKLAEVCLAPV
eukprot:TRINITY_DN1850_c0_g2_i1.p1 TRINITY_DN1850_c0_g2~~TRINITY_DN1850_c0_g2_i1.p1  ORF type:complete len:188 (+),score=41.44 TRINITY_DN1850_c0_g2_i1:38-601(+)